MIKIAVVKEQQVGEHRVAISPETVKKYVEWGAEVHIEHNAGEASTILDSDYASAGAALHRDKEDVTRDADVLLQVQPLAEDSLPLLKTLKKNAVIVGFFDPYSQTDLLNTYAENGLTSFAMELIPRISRAQSMDALSSQANLAGYRAVIDAVAQSGKAVPMLMTAAGTIAPARTLVLGAGVAGLQAIATAKRLGSVVSAFDVRPAVKEQVESLGANFIQVEQTGEEEAETKGGYAKEMSEEYKKRQQSLIHEVLKKQDMVITTALIPGKPAPVLITEAMVKDMKQGSVIVDLAVAMGGNCPLSKKGKIVQKHGVTIIGYDNMPSRLATDASRLYAKNLQHFMALLIKDKSIVINREDDIIKGAMLTHQGAIVHPQFKGEE